MLRIRSVPPLRAAARASTSERPLAITPSIKTKFWPKHPGAQQHQRRNLSGGQQRQRQAGHWQIGPIVLLEWDQRKADLNYRKHGISFEEAATALEDKLSKILPDPDHSRDEERFIAFAISARGRLLVICACIPRRAYSLDQCPQSDGTGTKDV